MANLYRFPLNAGLFAAAFVLASCSDTLDTRADVASGQAWVDDMVATWQPRLEAARGATFVTPVQAVWIRSGGYDSLSQALSARYPEAMTETAWDLTERTMVALGMVDSLGMWNRARAAFDGGSILGFYLPLNRTLYVFDNPDRDELAYTIVHEMVHALQDQRFGLEGLSAGAREVDESRAVVGMVEGEAEHVTIAAVQGNPSAEWMRDTLRAQRGSLDDLAGRLFEWGAPQGIPLSMMLPDYMPYVFGAGFIAEQRVGGGWGAIDALFRTPVRTSRKVFAPALVDTFVDWTPGAAPAVSGAWRPLQTGRFGAIELAGLLWRPGSDMPLDSLVHSWMGDRFWSFERADGTPGLLWRLRFSDERSALQAGRALWDARAGRRVAAGLSDSASPFQAIGSSSTPDGARSQRVVVVGSEVVVVDGFARQEGAALAERLLELPLRTAFAGRALSVSPFSTWQPPRPPLPLPPPRIPGVR